MIATAPEGYPQQPQYAQPAVHYDEPPQSTAPVQQPYYASAPEQSVVDNSWQPEPQQSAYAPHSTYQAEQTLQVEQKYQPDVGYVAPQPDVELQATNDETKPSRPPLYYFEEVEEKRAREREQLAAWYQPIPEPVKEPQPIKSASVAPVSSSVPPVETAVAVTSLASGVKKPRWRQGRRQPLQHPFSVLQTVVLRVHRLKKGLAHNYLGRSACAYRQGVSWHPMVLNCHHKEQPKKKLAKHSAGSMKAMSNIAMTKSMLCSRMS